ncbi:MAG: trigger factor [Ruminococcaceae bacterium]|nr:trigger factor [Oscillospiraceae bacterium]
MSIIKCEKTEKSAFALEFSVDKATFEAAINKVYRQQVKNINIPGFRKGKAPRAIVERMYGKGVFYEDAANELLPAAYEAALEESKLQPVGRAEFDIVSIDENGIVFSAVVPVKPAVEIECYKGIEATRDVAEVSEVEIDNEITVIRERNSREIEVTDAAAEMGNTVTIDFEGSVDGVLFEGGTGTDYALRLGSGSFIPGFEEQVAGHNIGEEFVVSVTFPENYHAEELAGKAAEFKTTIKAIKKIELPELDDDFAKDVSEFDTMAEYRADIEAKIRKRHEDAAESTFEEAIIKALTEKLAGEEIPEAMFEAEQENQLRDFDNRLRMQGLDLSTYSKYTGMDLNALRAQMRPQAENFVKVRLALEKVAELESIEATEEEIEAEYNRLAESYKMEAEQIKTMIPAESLTADLKVKKAMELVKANAVAPAKAE